MADGEKSNPASSAAGAILACIVMVVGGFALFGTPADADSASDTGNLLPSGRHDASAVWTGGEFLVFGGYNGAHLGEILRYVPGANPTAWKTFSPFLGRSSTAAVWDARDLPGIGCPGGCAYVIGGQRSDNVITTEILRVNLTPGASPTVAGNLPAGRVNPGAVIFGSSVYIIGGTDGSGAPQGSIYRLDPLTGEVDTMQTVLQPGRAAAAVASDGTSIYILGGRADADGYSATRDVLKYDPQAAAPITSLDNSTFERTSFAAYASDGARLFILGGFKNQCCGTNRILVFDMGTRQTTVSSQTLNFSLAHFGGAFDGTSAYTFGGAQNFAQYILRYTPDVLETTPPTVAVALSCTTPGNPGWCRSSSFTYTVTTDEGTLSCTVDGNSAPCTGTVSGEGPHTVAGTATDAAGNTGNASESLAIDSTNPDLAIVVDCATPGNAGWCRGSVTVTASAGDAGSGLASGSPSCTVDGASAACGTTPVSGDGAHRACISASDVAGNSAGPQCVDFDIDATAPGIAVSGRSPEPNDNGWANVDVTVTWDCTDATSGPVAMRVSQATSDEDSNLSVTGTCQDLAGNTASNTVTGIKVDKTAPSITFKEQTPPPNVNGWNNANVTVTWSCDDALSRPEASTVNQTVITDGFNQSATGACRDLAGNTASDTRRGINIDRTRPTVALADPAPGHVYVADKDITRQGGVPHVADPPTPPVIVGDKTVTATAYDALSGVWRVEFYVDDNLCATVTAAPYASLWHSGTATGGNHTIVVRAFDLAGNRAETKPLTVVTVPNRTGPPASSSLNIGGSGPSQACGVA